MKSKSRYNRKNSGSDSSLDLSFDENGSLTESTREELDNLSITSVEVEDHFSKPLITYDMDYDPKAEHEKKTYQVYVPGGRTLHDVGMAFGDSIEFLIRETYNKLEQVRQATPGGWNAARRFRELDNVLEDAAGEAYESIVTQDYPNAADKTHVNYDELKRQIITQLSDHTQPGDVIYRYLQAKLKYMDCKMRDGSGRIEKPNTVLSGIRRLSKYGASMHHTRGANYMTDNDEKHIFWNTFPKEMQSWLSNDQNIDPFDTNHPMDAQDIADNMQRYWNMYLKKIKRHDIETPKTERSTKATSHKSDTDTTDDAATTIETDETSAKKQRASCPIQGHEKYWHGWSKCYLNPHSAKFNEYSAEEFYNNEAVGDNSWYVSI